MRKTIARFLMAAVCAGGMLAAQTPPAPAPAAASAKPAPKIKSEKERQAVLAIQNATDPDARIAAADNLLTKFADTDFKLYALQAQARSAREKGDVEAMTVYSERVLEADPKNYDAMLLLGGGLAQRTREFDLDKEQKLTKATEYANNALEALKTAEPPAFAQMSPQQWEAARKDYMADAHEVLGNVALVRKKYDVAITEFKTAADMASTPNPTTMARLVQAYNQANKFPEAIETSDKVLALPNLNPQVKQFVTNQKDFATKMSGGAKK